MLRRAGLCLAIMSLALAQPPRQHSAAFTASQPIRRAHAWKGELTVFKAGDVAHPLRRGASSQRRQTDGLNPSRVWCFRALTMRSLGSNTASGGKTAPYATAELALGLLCADSRHILTSKKA